MTNQENNSKDINKNEIDLVEVFKLISRKKGTIIKSAIGFLFIGLLFALFSEKEYTASTLMVRQTSNQISKLGGLSSIASLAGFNLDMTSMGADFAPALYPKILNSHSFQLELMSVNYDFDEVDHPINLIEYYSDYYNPGLFGFIYEYTLGLPGKFLRKRNEVSNKIIQSSAVVFTDIQEEIREILQDNLTIELNEKDGYFIIKSKFHQALLSAQIVLKAQDLLQQYITKYKIEKASLELGFIEDRYIEKKDDFELAQNKLANYRDANQNISNVVVKTYEERLEYEYQLAFDVYQELAKQLEQSKIKVKEEMPVFSIIEEVSVPNEKSKPKRLLIIVFSLFVGIFLGTGLVFINLYIDTFKTLSSTKV